MHTLFFCGRDALPPERACLVGQIKPQKCIWSRPRWAAVGKNQFATRIMLHDRAQVQSALFCGRARPYQKQAVFRSRRCPEHFQDRACPSDWRTECFFLPKLITRRMAQCVRKSHLRVLLCQRFDAINRTVCDRMRHSGLGTCSARRQTQRAKGT